MRAQTVDERVERLEVRVTGIEALPARIDDLTQQIVQLRADMASRFAAVDEQLHGLRADMRGGEASLRAEIGICKELLRAEMGDREAGLRAEMREGFDTLAREMRVLHEDVIERIAKLQENRSPRPRPRRR